MGGSTAEEPAATVLWCCFHAVSGIRASLNGSCGLRGSSGSFLLISVLPTVFRTRCWYVTAFVESRKFVVSLYMLQPSFGKLCFSKISLACSSLHTSPKRLHTSPKFFGVTCAVVRLGAWGDGWRDGVPATCPRPAATAPLANRGYQPAMAAHGCPRVHPNTRG